MSTPIPSAADAAPVSAPGFAPYQVPVTAPLPRPVSAPGPASLAAPMPERVLAIDALRGFDMFWIAGPDLGHWLITSVLVLICGSMPPWLSYQMDHPKWLGFSAWDMIMPLFLFIVGASMPFSVQRRLDAGDSRAVLYGRVLRRAVILWILGMVSQGHLLDCSLSTLKPYSNTLQSIASGYLIATVVMVEIRQIRFQAGIAFGLLIVYWLLMSFVPVPGQVAGLYTPDENLAIWIDRTIMGSAQDGTHYTWILSSLGFGATVLMGVLAGHVLRLPLPPPRRLAILVAAGVACLIGGWLWSFVMPIIKHLWTSSMVLWAGGWSLLLLALFYYVLDMLGWRWWSGFFVVIGANAIAAYMSQPLLDIRQIGHHLFDGLCKHFGPGKDAALAFLIYVLLWGALWWLHKNRIFIRI